MVTGTRKKKATTFSLEMSESEGLSPVSTADWKKEQVNISRLLAVRRPWHPLTAKILLSAPAPYTYIHLTSTNCLSYTYICKKHLAKYCALKNGLIESFYGFSLILNKCLSTPACVFFLLFSLVFEFFNNLSLWWISQKHKGLPPS